MDPEKSAAQDEETGKVMKGGCRHGIATPLSDILLLPTLAAASLLGDDDTSVKMWTLSISHATQHDTAMADRWKNDMDGILIYVRFGTIHRCLVPH